MSTHPLFQNLDDWRRWLNANPMHDTLSFKEGLEKQELQTLEGELNLTLLPRLRSALSRPDANTTLSFVWSLDRTTSPLPQCILSIKSNNSIPWQLACQRCLSPMPWTLDSSSTFWIAENETHFEESGVDPEDEAFFYDEPITLLQHIEDEALLALPYSPRHPENQCKMTATLREPTQDKPHPFAGLASLKGTSD